MKYPEAFPRDYSDPLEVALLICKAADLKPGTDRDTTAFALAAYIETRISISGDYTRLAMLCRLLSPNFYSMPERNFEAALLLHVRACAGELASNLAPDHLRGLSQNQIVSYVLTLELPSSSMPRSRAKPKAKRAARKR